jgi:hypothetical protein
MPRWVQNGARPLPGGGVSFPIPGIALARQALPWLEPALDSNRLELALQVRSLLPQQSGPARILTFSGNHREGNLTLGQEGADLILRLRTSGTDPVGMIAGEPVARVPDLFRTPDWVEVRVLIEPGLLRLSAGDHAVLERPLPRFPFATWDPSLHLALGNEVIANRPWLGEVRRAVVGSGGVQIDYADPDRLRFPGGFLRLATDPRLVPFRDLSAPDVARNLLMYIPLGFLLGLLGAAGGRGRWQVVLGALLGAAAISLSMEVLQVLVPRRVPSVNDLIFNTLSGGLGGLLAIWIGRRRRREGAPVRDRRRARRTGLRPWPPPPT